jgi:nucleoside-diphosphate-sugar epimerase
MMAPRVAGDSLNVACGGRISLNEVVAAIVELTGRSVDPLYVASRRGEVRHSMASIERAREVLGYEPAVGFRDGLARTLEYFERSLRRGEGMLAETESSGRRPIRR